MFIYGRDLSQADGLGIDFHKQSQNGETKKTVNNKPFHCWPERVC